MSRTRLKIWAGFVVAILSFVALLAISIILISSAQNAITVANPNNSDAVDADGFLEVDWDYWRSVNPNIIGWINIPNTDINSAIVQAPTEDPTFYLTHDVHNGENPHGCPYLDSQCADLGLDSKNAVVFGHHIDGGVPMFATLANYSDKNYAQEHSTVLIQTPTNKRILHVIGVAIVNGYDQTKRTQFENENDFQNWLSERMEECCVCLNDSNTNSCTTLVTCSYNRFSNERTLVYAA